MRSRLLVSAAAVLPFSLLALAHARGSALVARQAQTPTHEPLATVVVRNPLPFAREDVVEAWVQQTQLPEFLVTGPDGKTALAQRVRDEATRPPGGLPTEKIAFLVRLPAHGVASYDVDHAVNFDKDRLAKGSPASVPPDRRHAFGENHTLENGRLRVTIDEAGEIASVYDKARGRETLGAPVRLDRWGELPWHASPEPFVGSAKVRVVEHGSVRAAIEVAHVADGARLLQTVRLAGGAAGDAVEVENRFDWKPSEAHPGGPPMDYRASFRVPVPRGRPDYGDEGGSSPDPNGGARKNGASFQGWIDLAGVDGGNGVGVLNPDGMASDRTEDGALRLTFHPRETDDGRGNRERESLVRFYIVPHAGDWRKGNLPQVYGRLTRPIQAFTAPQPTRR